MYFVYLLKHVQTHELYYGYTNDLERRLQEHNPQRWKMIYYEAYLSESDARERENENLNSMVNHEHALKVVSKIPCTNKISAGFNSHSDLHRPNGLRKSCAH